MISCNKETQNGNTRVQSIVYSFPTQLHEETVEESYTQLQGTPGHFLNVESYPCFTQNNTSASFISYGNERCKEPKLVEYLQASDH